MSLKDDFMAYHNDNPQVWVAFKKYSIELIWAGHTKFSQRMVWENMRMDSMLSTTGELYKLNNNYTKCYAEVFMIRFPQYGDIFNLRGTSVLNP